MSEWFSAGRSPRTLRWSTRQRTGGINSARRRLRSAEEWARSTDGVHEDSLRAGLAGILICRTLRIFREIRCKATLATECGTLVSPRLSWRILSTLSRIMALFSALTLSAPIFGTVLLVREAGLLFSVVHHLGWAADRVTTVVGLCVVLRFTSFPVSCLK